MKLFHLCLVFHVFEQKKEKRTPQKFSESFFFINLYDRECFENCGYVQGNYQYVHVDQGNEGVRRGCLLVATDTLQYVPYVHISRSTLLATLSYRTLHEGGQFVTASAARLTAVALIRMESTKTEH